ncbi:uncharacterized protein FIBRA_04229 [Fibroporia radiculosa]|uniref:Inner centromere protein ARK-binding domain-containing protein n=1 Tax=Fibroporia radiculosa TaxID=599839 RepID=J4IA21_9APHY|nr:uncharacterized protein FIBRA_04229 [Fibroporia radiculosa]CCM02151.1 predicted protein [Fibroporia radiculosa]
MDASKPGEAGVIAWCNSVRFNMAKDPGRQFLDEQIQNSLDFLDSYLENVLRGPKTESVTELLKTPGRKKNAPVRTRAGTVAAAKVKAVISMSLDESDAEQENRAPVNSFTKALLQAKEVTDDLAISVSPTRPLESQRPASSQQGFVPTEVFQPAEPVVHISSPPPQEPGHEDPKFDTRSDHEPQELSMIAEDDELVERSRLSMQPQPSAPEVPEEAVQAPIENGMDTEEEDSAPTDITSTSANTFHSFQLGSPQNTESRSSKVLASEAHVTEPLPRIERPPLENDYAMTAPLPIVPTLPSESHVDELNVPIRDGPPASHSAPDLARKPSLSQLGLPAPSPLHKSTRVVREPSVGAGPTVGQPPGGKRSSWLVKAREVKAMEGTGKRASTVLGTTFAPSMLGTKRKSGEVFGLMPRASSAALGAVARASEEEERHQKVPKLAAAVDLPDKEQVRQANVDREPVDKGKGVVRTDQEPHLLAPAAVSEHQEHQTPPALYPTLSKDNIVVPLKTEDEDDGMLDRFKRTVEGFGARAGKSMGKSLGGNAAAALAEARAAAEARVAERNKVEGREESEEPPLSSSPPADSTDSVAPAGEARLYPEVPHGDVPGFKTAERRLSVSDLVSSSEKKQKSRVVRSPPSSAITAGPSRQSIDAANISSSTTPPNSPPATHKPSFAAPPPPVQVFSKPPPPPTVFVAPSAPAAPSTSQPTRTTGAPGVGRDFSFKLPTTNPFSLPAAVSLGVPATLASPSSQKGCGPLSAQSSKASLFSDVIFDREDEVPAWMATTQDTEYSIPPSQAQLKSGANVDDLDDDDSWHVDEKFTSNHMWTPFGFASADKDDTWSTLPSRSISQKGGDTGPITTNQNFTKSFADTRDFDLAEMVQDKEDVEPSRSVVPGAFRFGADPELQEEADIADEAMEIDPDLDEEEDELDELVAAGASTVSLVQPKGGAERPRSQSQQSMASTASSQSQPVGFFGQASKLVSSVLGSTKKVKGEPVKSLQLAAQAAKKQQEEIEKKATRLKEMENRRQLALQRKAEEDKARAIEEDRKIKEENDRRKREREEHTDKRPLRATGKKGDDDTTKKRKITTEAEKKVESKKPPSKDKKDNPLPPRVPKAGPSGASNPTIKIGPPPKSALKQQVTATDTKSSKTVKAVPSSSNLKTGGKGKGKAAATDDDEPQPTRAAPLRTQAPSPKQPPVASETIELPDINSEYSDSEDEDRPRTFDPPNWAQSPELRQALQQQSTMNPDDIFGRIGPLRMEEIFRTRQSRFRARTSSANWSGADQLTAEEEREYARRMGFK